MSSTPAGKATPRFKPPRVWITPDDNYPWEMPMPDSVEYVRADLQSAAVEGLVKAARFALTTPGMIKGRDELAAAVAAVEQLKGDV